jgi:hypothetical protein
VTKLCAMACAVLLLAGCARGSAPNAPESSQPALSGQPVPLDGLYVIEWDRGTHIGVRIDTGVVPGEHNAFAFRTSCRGGDECVVAGGGVVDANDLTAPLPDPHVGDYTDGHWTIVWRSEKPRTCDGADGRPHSAPVWSSFDIANDLTTTATLVGTGDCPFIETHHPTVTKADDSIRGPSIPDPMDQPARVVPIGAGFTGDYTVTRTPRGGGAETLTNRRVTTHCLRAEPQCVSTSVNDEAAEFSVLEFERDTFRGHATAGKQPCGSGGDGIADVTETPKPTTTSSPLHTLTGERVTAFSSGCAGTVTDDVTYTRADD